MVFLFWHPTPPPLCAQPASTPPPPPEAQLPPSPPPLPTVAQVPAQIGAWHRTVERREANCKAPQSAPCGLRSPVYPSHSLISEKSRGPGLFVCFMQTACCFIFPGVYSSRPHTLRAPGWGPRAPPAWTVWRTGGRSTRRPLSGQGLSHGRGYSVPLPGGSEEHLLFSHSSPNRPDTGEASAASLVAGE